MEHYRDEIDLLEELVGLTESDYDLSTINGWPLDNPLLPTAANACFPDSCFPFDQKQSLNCAPFGDEFSPTDFALDSSTFNLGTQTLPYAPEDCYSVSVFGDGDGGALIFGNQNPDPCKMEPLPNFDMGLRPETRPKKKGKGQPSKNLMAERRRRKRLNDRLSLLRSVVPKITKMDRISLLRDTIDYTRELVDRIKELQQEMYLGSNEVSILNYMNSNQISLTNSPKFEVERRNGDTRVEIGCGLKGGMLVSTVTTLEALGLEIQHCLISCFNDFSLQASCSQDLKKLILDSEDIKQALMRNVGFEGREQVNDRERPEVRLRA